MRQLVTHALCLVLIPMLARGAPPGRALEPVEAREYDGGWGRKGVQLIFKRLPPDHDQEALTREDGQAIRAAFEEVYGKQEPLPPPRYLGGTRLASVGTQYVSTAPPEWQEKIRKDYEELYRKGPSALSLPGNLENSRFFQALRLSPQYMGEGAREAAMVLFSSPAFIVSMAASMTLYLAALAAPEPVLSKGFVAAVSLWLLVTYGATEIMNVALAVKQLYQEAEAAQNFEQLDKAARNFGPKIGGTALRVLVTIALGRLAGKLPQVPKAPGGGGLWTRLGMPRYALTRNVTLQGAPVVQGAGAQVTVVVGEAAAAETSVANGTQFEPLCERAGMSLNDPANKLFVIGHKGPHPEQYHQEVHDRLNDAIKLCAGPDECRRKLVNALDEIADDLCRSGSRLNKLVTKKP